MSVSIPRSIHGRILHVSLPLVASLGATTVMEFTDRLFLARYSLDAIAAATPAGILLLLALSIFLGTAGYVSVFVAQYMGQAAATRLDALSGRPSMWPWLAGRCWLFSARSLTLFSPWPDMPRRCGSWRRCIFACCAGRYKLQAEQEQVLYQLRKRGVDLGELLF